ncbi:MAG: hypothetical protein QXL51_01085 [Candidatus Aenigmatarchaeota archaeon]
MRILDEIKNKLKILKRETINYETKSFLKEIENKPGSLDDKEAFCYLLDVERWEDAVKIVRNEFKKATENLKTIRRKDIEEFADGFAVSYTPITSSRIFEFYTKYPEEVGMANEMQEINAYTDMTTTAQAGIYNFLYTMTLFVLIIVMEVDINEKN